MTTPLLSRFLRYVSFDTQSDPGSKSCPSTPGQTVLGAQLVKELNELGLDAVEQDSNGYVYAKLPGNPAKPTIGFIAHMDTASDYSGKDVKPQLVTDYQGQEILLEGTNEQLSPAAFPSLNNYIGQTLLTTDGTSLLGADNKAGIAAILTAVEQLKAVPAEERCNLAIGFTPDEEIGRGANHFDVEKFGADWAFTIDGGELGELECESFNAASANLTFTGVNVHPGTAKGTMINSQEWMARFMMALPALEKPEHTEDREGFFHVIGCSGGVEKSSCELIIRDHDRALFEARKETLKALVAELNQQAGQTLISLDIEDSYYNMGEVLAQRPEIMESAKAAFVACDIEPLIKPIRGGTDGSRLSFMGLPCPNIFTGGHNFHGRYEYICVESMEKSVDVIVKLATQPY